MALPVDISLIKPFIVTTGNESVQGVSVNSPQNYQFGLVIQTYPECDVISEGQYCFFSLEGSTNITINDIEYFLINTDRLKFIEGAPV